MNSSKVTLRRAKLGDAPGITHVHIATWKTTYAGHLPDEFLNNLEKLQGESRLKMWTKVLEPGNRNTSLWVAETSPGIIGFVHIGKNRDRPPPCSGEIYAIYLLKDWQGKGAGRRLFETATLELKRLGMPSFSLWVLKGSPTEGFYKHVGGMTDIEKTEEVGEHPVEVTEIRYLWKFD